MDDSQLTQDQLAAAQRILPILSKNSTQTQVVLSGYAGTGKSYTTGVIAHELVKAGFNVLAITHAHKALAVIAKELPEAVDTATVFSALGWRINPRTQATISTGLHKLVGVDVLLVDEASMIDRRMLSEITRLSDILGFTVLWIGDPAQLPPVSTDKGDAQESTPPVFQLIEEQVRLTQIVRQAKDSPIIRASMYLRECLQHHKQPDPLEMQQRIGNAGAMQIVTGGIADAASYVVSAKEHGLDARYIAWTNKAVNTVNAVIVRLTHPQGSPRLLAGDPVTFGTSHYKGDKRIATTDAQARVVTSESVGVYGAMQLECLLVQVDIGGRLETVYTPCDGDAYTSELRRLKSQHRRYRDAAKKAEEMQDFGAMQKYLQVRDELGIVIQKCSEDYADLRHIFAITAHKSQGSTFDVAVIDWADMAKNSDVTMLCRLLYVACTRPSKYLVILV